MSSATKLELLNITTLGAQPFWIYANNLWLIFHAFFDEAEKKISDGSTSKFILYVKKRLHAKIRACIRPVTTNTLSDLTIKSCEWYVRWPMELLSSPEELSFIYKPLLTKEIPFPTFFLKQVDSSEQN